MDVADEQIKKMKKQLIISALGFCAATSLHGAVVNVERLTNGSFESGFTGWNNNALGAASQGFFLTDGSSGSPNWGFAIPGPVQGAQYAVTEQDGLPASHALTQSFSIPVGALGAQLSYSYFMNNYFDFYADGGLDLSTPSQHARIDIVTGNDPWTMDSVVAQMWLGADLSEAFTGWHSGSVDLIALGLVPGSEYTLRFASSAWAAPINFGVDDVSVSAQIWIEDEQERPVPEVQTYATILGALMIGAQAYRRSRKA